MTKPNKNRASGPRVADRILSAMQDFADALEKGEDLSKRFRVTRLRLDLLPSKHPPHLVRQTRTLVGASTEQFAMLLGVSARALRSWEQGRSAPSRTACRFMDEIRRDPQYWISRLKTATVVA